ncbi:hypothetical protein DCC85_10815 [Paenibacillus sp. CAA11]|uniref:hypothetical protein n=1 Tax=Paenibacillus sp. CAA11 TaxID=1532905 RepID=UPI000D363AC1|nr:hypothetical protein [Paenibacillus sp. CAA11]AWB44666.1 hypothetical protein DCC85_10815 [Paenibacillus sp. CAA11]
MRECCFKINLSLEEAKKRYREWSNEDVQFEIDEAGICMADSIQISEAEEGWTYFIDFEGEAFFGLSREAWIKLAMDSSVIYAYYDENFNAELVVIENGKLIREFARYEDEPDANADFGVLACEESSAIDGWEDVADYIEQELII